MRLRKTLTAVLADQLSIYSKLRIQYQNWHERKAARHCIIDFVLTELLSSDRLGHLFDYLARQGICERR